MSNTPERSATRALLVPMLACAMLALVAVAAAVLLGGSSPLSRTLGRDTQVATSVLPGPAANDESRQHVYMKGQAALTSGIQVTLDAVSDPWRPTDLLEAAQPGHRLVAVELSLVNESADPASFLAPLQVEASDSEGRPWAASSLTDPLPAVDGDLPGYGRRRGWVVIEVGDDASGLQVRVKGSVTATGSVFSL